MNKKLERKESEKAEITIDVTVIGEFILEINTHEQWSAITSIK